MLMKDSKLSHSLSQQDDMLVASIENHRLQVAEFNHEVHVKLAYCYLAKLGFKSALKKMPDTLQKFLNFNGVDRNKFHLTLTQAWLTAVWHFMQQSGGINSADEFVKTNPVLLNKDLLASHYSHELLFSDLARKKFVNPDLNPFPDID